MKKIKLLIVSLYYPPIESIASYRIEAFSKYLNKDRFDIDIISLHIGNSLKYEEKDNVKIYRIPNKNLLSPFEFKSGSNIIIHKAKVLWNLTLEIFLGKYNGWRNLALKKAVELYRVKQYNVVLSSFAPIESHLVALFLKRKFSTIKWIADMRDEISDNPFIPSFLKNKYKKYEKEILSYCDALTTVSKPILESFENKALQLNRKIIFEEVRNGFDFKIDINTLNGYKKNKKFTISYVGSFYGKINPTNFFRAIIKLEKKILKNINIKIVGLRRPINIPLEIKDNVELIPKVPHYDAIKIMKESDALLLIHPKGRKGVYTGKLFEYLGALRPIIAIVDKEDVAANLIKEANAGYIADFDNIYEIRDIVEKAYRNWEKGIMPKFNFDIIMKHHRKKQVEKLEKLILLGLCNEES